MNDPTEKKCPKCGQKLRFPQDIGGILMACPSCGHRFHSDFKLGDVGRSRNKGEATTLFELPWKIVSRIARYFLPR